MRPLNSNMFKRSVIIVAHPDDEVLWFSSVLNKVDHVIICFVECTSKPWLGVGRRRCLTEHPMKNFSYLGLEESEALSANWERLYNKFHY